MRDQQQQKQQQHHHQQEQHHLPSLTFLLTTSTATHKGGGGGGLLPHYFQFCQTDTLRSSKHVERVKYVREFRNFNKREFNEELLSIEWSDVANETAGAERSYLRFYRKMADILNYVAPHRRMTQKEIRLEQRPWVTQGLLISMRVRDNLYKQLANKKDHIEKEVTFQHYKRYRNMIVNLLRGSNNNHYTSFFLENQGNVKKNLGRYTKPN